MQFPVNGVEMKLPPIKMTGSKMILLSVSATDLSRDEESKSRFEK